MWAAVWMCSSWVCIYVHVDILFSCVVKVSVFPTVAVLLEGGGILLTCPACYQPSSVGDLQCTCTCHLRLPYIAFSTATVAPLPLVDTSMILTIGLKPIAHLQEDDTGTCNVCTKVLYMSMRVYMCSTLWIYTVHLMCLLLSSCTLYICSPLPYQGRRKLHRRSYSRSPPHHQRPRDRRWSRSRSPEQR